MDSSVTVSILQTLQKTPEKQMEEKTRINSRETKPVSTFIQVRVTGVSKWVEEYENDVNNTQWASQAPYLNPIEQLWEILAQFVSALHFHEVLMREYLMEENN